MEKIFCFGDGFATGHIWPEWPQILQALVPTRQVVVTAGIGAGQEFLVSGFVDQVEQMRNSLIIFQWPWPVRFDKMLQDDSWSHTIANDPVYSFNVNTDVNGSKWWLSSASTDQDIQKYHNHYVQYQQHLQRQKIYQCLVSHTASNLKSKIVHTSTESQDSFSRRARFSNTRMQEVQPSPVVHFYWLIEKIVPQTDIVIDAELQKKLETAINQTVWKPYDPDCKKIWINICNKLSN